MNRDLKNLYDIINRDLLPPELRLYYQIDPNDQFDLALDIRNLKSLLLAYKTKNTEVNKTTYIFLAVLGLFSGEYRLSLYFIRKIESLKMTRRETSLIMEIKYSIRKLDKILVLVSKPQNEDEEDKIYLTSIKDLARRINRGTRYTAYRGKLVVKYINTITAKDFRSCFTKFEQVFIVGHGDDISMDLGEKKLQPSDIISKLKGKLDKPNLLGLFSCGEAFNIKDIWDNVDYFITDTSQSVPVFFEMFLYGYISSYYRNSDVLKAFDSGWILPTIRATGDPYFQLKEKGYLVRP
ncbi:MAG: hypothetical protein SH808_03770 [Saprospiraceae bacterium]|nr:hypothetical protein [Saprospiraceae bacterium]MDZ4752859.1 hypothetical protein [Flavobacteriales bacterium]